MIADNLSMSSRILCFLKNRIVEQDWQIIKQSILCKTEPPCKLYSDFNQHFLLY